VTDAPLTGPVKFLPISIQDAMETYLCNNACLGQGDLRANITLEMLQRTETADTWTINRRKMGRADVMEMLLDLVSSGFSIPEILTITGMPKARTYMTWLNSHKEFADLMTVADDMYARQQAWQAEQILAGNDDPKQAFRDNARANLKMRLAEVTNPKRFGKKNTLDINHHDDLSGTEVWSRMAAMLETNAKIIEEHCPNIKITVVGDFQDADVVEREEVAPDPLEALGMQGKGTEPSEWDDDLEFPDGQQE